MGSEFDLDRYPIYFFPRAASDLEDGRLELK